MSQLSRRTVLVAAAAAVLASPARANQPKVYAEGGVAIGGTDPVAYFTQGAPVAGTAQHRVEWNGAVWQFASAENKAAFAANPTAYAPQYGGYCAYAVSRGYTASTVPVAWKITDGKLYLNYSRSVAALWRTQMRANIRKADANWPGVLTQ